MREEEGDRKDGGNRISGCVRIGGGRCGGEWRPRQFRERERGHNKNRERVVAFLL